MLDDWPDEAVRGFGAVAGFCDSAVAPIRARARTTRVRIILKYTFPFDDKGLEVCKSLYDMQFAAVILSRDRASNPSPFCQDDGAIQKNLGINTPLGNKWAYGRYSPVIPTG